jgi:hypothetical protein
MFKRALQVFPEKMWNELAPQQRRMVDNAIARVSREEGVDAVTVDRLEGVKELVTQHLWSVAHTQAFNKTQGQS